MLDHEREKREKEKCYVVFLLPGYKAKKELVFQSYLTVSNKLKCAYWPACIKAGFAPLLRLTARPCLFHRCTQEKKRKTHKRLQKESVFLFFFNIGFTIVLENGVSCSCRLTQTPRAKTIQSSPSRPLGGARLHAAPTRAWSADFFLSFCRAQGRKGLITYFERFTSYYRTTPTPHLLSCAFICLFLY